MGDHRNPALDGIRALAALAVLAFHSHAPVAGGFLGVDVFFVLSGFLITSILRTEIDDSRDVDLRRFYIRRTKRLVPALLLMLVVYITLRPLLPIPMTTSLEDASLAGAYLADFTAATGRPIALRHTWSLAVEAQFYLLWPFIVTLATRMKRPAFILAILYVAATAWRAAVAPGDWLGAYYRPDTHCSGLILGALLTYVPWRNRLIGVAGLLVTVACLTGWQWGWTPSLQFGVTMTEVGSALLILGVLKDGGVVAEVLASGAARSVGLISYGVYLWHFPIAWALRDHFAWWVTLPITLVVSIGMASLSYLTVERNFRTARTAVA